MSLFFHRVSWGLPDSAPRMSKILSPRFGWSKQLLLLCHVGVIQCHFLPSQMDPNIPNGRLAYSFGFTHNHFWTKCDRASNKQHLLSAVHPKPGWWFARCLCWDPLLTSRIRPLTGLPGCMASRPFGCGKGFELRSETMKWWVKNLCKV